MKTILKWAGYAAGGLVVLALVGAGAVYAGSSMAMAKHYPLGPPKPFRAAAGPAAVAEGAELARVMGCTDCHGADLRGQMFDDIPLVARLYAPNLTLRTATWSDTDFERAIRHGLRPDGRSLYVMPSSLFARFSDAQTAALIAFIRSAPVGGSEQPRLQAGPLGRVAVLSGDVPPEAVAATKVDKDLPADVGPQHAAARSFVAVTCAECHGPDLTGLASIKAPDLKVAAAYDLPAFKRLLRTGQGSGGRSLGMMSSSARVRYSGLSDPEIEGIHAYLTARALAPAPAGG